MIKEHRKIIKNHIIESFKFQEKFSDFEIDSNFQLLLSQLDLFKVISSLVIGIIGLGYIYNVNLSGNFLSISIVFATITLLLSISYTREIIDSCLKQNENTHKMITEKMNDGIKIAIKALEEKDSSVFFNYAKENSNKEYPELQLNYIGEIIIFSFNLSIGFLILSFFAFRYGFLIFSYQTVLVLLLTYFLSFKNWSMNLSAKLSKNINRR